MKMSEEFKKSLDAEIRIAEDYLANLKKMAGRQEVEEVVPILDFSKNLSEPNFNVDVKIDSEAIEAIGNYLVQSGIKDIRIFPAHTRPNEILWKLAYVFKETTPEEIRKKYFLIQNALGQICFQITEVKIDNGCIEGYLKGGISDETS